MALEPYRDLQVYYGDLHNHCDISYGRGDLESAYENARLQLDFASVTGHAHWPDMPVDEDRLAYLVAFHQWGFDRLADCWDRVQEVTERYNEDGRFTTFLSFEWHSLRHGDYCIYYKGSRGEIIRAPDLSSMRNTLADLTTRGIDAMMIPHHICYLEGYRGINWADYDASFSPVVEIVSMHGCGEDDDAPRPYLHTMGPRDGRSSMLRGLRDGHRFGVIGSTDHHAAHPGSHNHGRLAVWAPELTRNGIWSALQQRRTYALTGDRIALAFAVNDAPMGAVAEPDADRTLDVEVVAGGPIDYVEIRKNGYPVARRSAHEAAPAAGAVFRGKVTLAVGWGEWPEPIDWEVRLEVNNGRLLDVEPRFKGSEMVTSVEAEPESYQISHWERVDDRALHFTTRTIRNPNTWTDGSQKITLEVEGDGRTQIAATINGQEVAYTIGDLRAGPRSGYLRGFVSEAYQFSRAVPTAEYHWRWRVTDRGGADGTDFYYARVRQQNDQWAWSSPVWI